MKWAKVLPRAAVWTALVLGSLAFLAPFLWQIRSSLLPMAAVFSYPPIWVPSEPRWQNYVEIFSIIPFATYYANTLFLVAVNIVGTLISNACIAFALARIPFKGRKTLFALSLGTLMLPTAVTMIPTYIEWSWLGGLNSFWPLTVPAFFGNAFFIFLLVQFFRGIPKEFDEAAFVDGASYPQILVRLILPMAAPALAVVVIFTFLNTWNDFMGPLLYLNDSGLFTLALGLKSLLSSYNSYWHLLMAAATLVVLPLIVVFFFAQKSFVEGLTAGGLKG
jgi:multiple sugar transport system permease protein